MLDTDFLVIGSGISGMSTAIKVAERCPGARVTLLSKSRLIDSNTRWAQGGIAIVTDFEADSYEKHVRDTRRAGDGLCNPQVVEFVVKEGPERLRELMRWGARFDRNASGGLDLGREGGHSTFRVVHRKDSTGLEIENTLIRRAQALSSITLMENHFVIDLITDHHIEKRSDRHPITCYGAYSLDAERRQIIKVSAKVTLLATGGSGQLYQYTTNHMGSTGDGIGLAYRAGAYIKNMPYVQFHPTALYGDFQSDRAFLVSEAVRGFGAKLRTKDGVPFMHKYHPQQELASRDIVARAIDNEMKVLGHPYVVLDCTELERAAFLDHFPNIYQRCKSIGIDPLETPIPVVPAAHYQCGGIAIDAHGQTSIRHLLAVGECSCSGLNGANRLASNSLLEGLVFGHRAALRTRALIRAEDFNPEVYAEIPDWNQSGMELPQEMIQINFLRDELKSIMSKLVGIVRSDERLALALEEEEKIYKATRQLYDKSILSTQLCELRNLTSVAYLIIQQSRALRENRGAFYNKDL